MPKIKANRDTFLKTSTESSDRLSADQRIAIAAGTELEINWLLPDRHQHSRIELKSLLKGRFNWFLFAPHFDPVTGISALWQQPKINRDIVIPNVPYFAQVDSRHDGWRYCFAHSVAMSLATLQPDFIARARLNGFQQPENYYISKLQGDTTDHRSHIQALREFGVDAYFSMTVSPADLQRSLLAGIPTPIGVAYKTSGHWITVKGIKNGNYIVNDPYGARAGASDSYFQISSDYGKEGENDVYSPEIMDQIFWDMRTCDEREVGWAVMITKVNGKETGISRNC